MDSDAHPRLPAGTGSIARGDERTVGCERAAIAVRPPEDLGLAAATRRLATAATSPRKEVLA